MRKLRHLGRLLAELAEFARQNHVYWMLPVVGALLLLGLLIIAGKAAAPFIYTLF